MARIRSVKPDFFTDADLCELSPIHRLLFQALWCQADRDGRLEDKPRELKVKCLPFDDCNVDQLLADLHARGFITRYEVLGTSYIAIPKFSEHQKFHRDERPVGFPAPPENPQRSAPLRATPHPESDTACRQDGTDGAREKPRLTSDVGRRTSVSGATAEPVAQQPTPEDPEADARRFFAWAQEERTKRLKVMPQSPQASVYPWYARAVAGPGSKRLREAWVLYLEDDWAKKLTPPCPWETWVGKDRWTGYCFRIVGEGRPKSMRPMKPGESDADYEKALAAFQAEGGGVTHG